MFSVDLPILIPWGDIMIEIERNETADVNSSNDTNLPLIIPRSPIWGCSTPGNKNWLLAKYSLNTKKKTPKKAKTDYPNVRNEGY